MPSYSTHSPNDYLRSCDPGTHLRTVDGRAFRVVRYSPQRDEVVIVWDAYPDFCASMDGGALLSFFAYAD